MVGVQAVPQGQWRPDLWADKIDAILDAGPVWWFWVLLFTLIFWLGESVVAFGTWWADADLKLFTAVVGATALMILGTFVFLVLQNIADFRRYGGYLGGRAVFLTALVFVALVATVAAFWLASFVEPAPRSVLWLPLVQLILALLSPDVLEFIIVPESRFGW